MKTGNTLFLILTGFFTDFVNSLSSIPANLLGIYFSMRIHCAFAIPVNEKALMYYYYCMP